MEKLAEKNSIWRSSLHVEYDDLVVDPTEEDTKYIRYAKFALFVYTRHIEDKHYPLDFIPRHSNVDDLDQAYINYLKACIVMNKWPSPEAAFAWLGVSKTQQAAWVRGTSGTDAHFAFVERVKQNLAMALEDVTKGGDVNPIQSMFAAKVHYGYVETQHKQISVSHTNALELKYNKAERDAYLKEIMDAGFLEDEDIVIDVEYPQKGDDNV